MVSGCEHIKRTAEFNYKMHQCVLELRTAGQFGSTAQPSAQPTTSLQSTVGLGDGKLLAGLRAQDVASGIGSVHESEMCSASLIQTRGGRGRGAGSTAGVGRAATQGYLAERSVQDLFGMTAEQAWRGASMAELKAAEALCWNCGHRRAEGNHSEHRSDHGCMSYRRNPMMTGRDRRLIPFMVTKDFAAPLGQGMKR